MPDFGDIDPDTGLPSARTQFEGTLDPNAPSVANGGISQADWEKYQQKRRRDALLGILGVLGGSVALGGVGAMAGGTGAAGAAGTGTAGTGTLAPIAGGAPWPVTPYVGTAAMSGTGAGLGAAGAGLGAAGTAGTGAAGTGAAGAAGTGALGMGWRDLLALVTGLAGVTGAALQKPKDLSPNTSTTDPQLKELLAMMMAQQRKREPLNDSILAMANGLLPTQYQRANPLLGGTSTTPPTPPPTSPPPNPDPFANPLMGVRNG